MPSQTQADPTFFLGGGTVAAGLANAAVLNGAILGKTTGLLYGGLLNQAQRQNTRSMVQVHKREVPEFSCQFTFHKKLMQPPITVPCASLKGKKYTFSL